MILFGENSEIKKQNTLLQVKFKALLMEEKNANLWWDVIQNIVQKDIKKVYRKYERNERLYIHRISQMEIVIPSFEYEPLVLSPKSQTSNEEEDKGDIDGARPSFTKIAEQLGDLKGGKDSLQKEAAKQTLK